VRVDQSSAEFQGAAHGRLTPVVAFELPITESGIDQLLESEADLAAPDLLPMTAIDPLVADAIQCELAGETFALYSADVGRGAGGYGVALEIVGVIANIGGALATLTGTIVLVQRLYRKLEKHFGHPPLVSLGTACFLAAADLSERFALTDFRLHGTGDTRSNPPDQSYTGNDCFYVIFEHGEDLFFYAVDAQGKVTFLGTARMAQLH
jgi:hypothetical protein